MWLIDNICRTQQKIISPDEGLEPSTLGLKVPRSTDWANRAYFINIFYQINSALIHTIKLEMFLYLLVELKLLY